MTSKIQQERSLRGGTLGKSFRGRKPRRMLAHAERKSGPSRPRDPEITKSPSTTLVDCLLGLRNNETRVTSEVKGLGGKIVMETKTSYPPELLMAFRGLFPAGRTYSFQMHQVLTISSSAGGATLGFVAISPSVASYGEWSAISSLFDEVVGSSSKIDLCTVLTPSAAVPPVDMCLAFDEQDLSSVPASYLSVYRLAESKTFVAQLGTGGSGRHSQSRKFTSRSWCNTATPYSTSPIGGLIGCWVYANSGLFGVSLPAFTASSITVARLRNRG